MFCELCWVKIFDCKSAISFCIFNILDSCSSTFLLSVRLLGTSPHKSDGKTPSPNILTRPGLSGPVTWANKSFGPTGSSEPSGSWFLNCSICSYEFWEEIQISEYLYKREIHLIEHKVKKEYLQIYGLFLLPIPHTPIKNNIDKDEQQGWKK